MRGLITLYLLDLLCNLLESSPLRLDVFSAAAFVNASFYILFQTTCLGPCSSLCSDGADETQIVGSAELAGAKVWQGSAL